jgi:serine/threonine protein phosphatase 1
MALSRLTRFLKRDQAPAPCLPPGLRLYAIGDIHGRLDLLDDLARQISDDLATAPEKVLTIFLGDYIDRGPDSAAVVERLRRRDFPTPFRALRGNHEEVVLKFLEDESVLENWRKFGGLETLHSYGVNVGEVMRGQGFGEARRSFEERLPEAHLRFFEDMELTAVYGDYYFCHAGARPGVPLDQQVSDDLLWIRGEFLDFDGAFGKVVVHGHTPVAAPDERHNRINIDTGAFATSVLTALMLEGTNRRFLFGGNRP